MNGAINSRNVSTFLELGVYRKTSNNLIITQATCKELRRLKKKKEKRSRYLKIRYLNSIIKYFNV